jgi:Arf-GAP/SH3 domain/ANK repeat/PH domain-containing protein
LDGNTALHLCAQLNKTECMKLLLRTRPDLANIENKAGKTPLDIARENRFELCTELVRFGFGRLAMHNKSPWSLCHATSY